MKAKMQNEEDEFYEELDKKTEKKSSCSLTGLAIFFTIIFLILGTLTILFFHNFKVSIPMPNTSLANSLQVDISTKEPKVEIPIKEEDLTAVLQAGLKGGGAQVEGAEAEISPSAINIEGKLKVLFRTKVSIEILPLVKDDLLYLKIIKMKTWKLGLPGIMKVEIEKSLNNLIGNQLAEFYKSYKVTDLQLENQKLTIFGTLK